MHVTTMAPSKEAECQVGRMATPRSMVQTQLRCDPGRVVTPRSRPSKDAEYQTGWATASASLPTSARSLPSRDGENQAGWATASASLSKAGWATASAPLSKAEVDAQIAQGTSVAWKTAVAALSARPLPSRDGEHQAGWATASASLSKAEVGGQAAVDGPAVQGISAAWKKAEVDGQAEVDGLGMQCAAAIQKAFELESKGAHSASSAVPKAEPEAEWEASPSEWEIIIRMDRAPLGLCWEVLGHSTRAVLAVQAVSEVGAVSSWNSTCAGRATTVQGGDVLVAVDGLRGEPGVLIEALRRASGGGMRLLMRRPVLC